MKSSKSDAMDGSVVHTMAVPKHGDKARFFKRRRDREQKDRQGPGYRPFIPKPDDDLIICRCEEITKGEIRPAVHEGSIHDRVKRYFARRYGLCQGQTCAV